jgi:hypothetical protein
VKISLIILYLNLIIHYISVDLIHLIKLKKKVKTKTIKLYNTWVFPYWPGHHPETESRANMGRGMKTRPIWKCPCIKLFITYFRHLEKRHPYWPVTKSRPILARTIWASIWKWSCSNPITGYFPGVWKYGQFTSGYIGHTKMSLFELSM